MKVLVLSAHPDDETIGAGGTIARLAAGGADVHLWVATETYEPRWPADEKARRRAEAEKAAAILGVGTVEFGGLPTMHLSSMPAIDVASAVGALVRRVAPEVVFAPPPNDINSDHSCIFNAALVACRALPETSVRALYAYEIPTTTRFLAPHASFPANTYVDISATIDTKLDAMRAYETELRDYPHPRSVEGLEIIALERGLGCGCSYAECFMLVSRRIAGEEPIVL
jgi:LmbE family N-acetylglucosaminyl deacetylase